MKLLLLLMFVFSLLATRSMAADKAESTRSNGRVFELRTYYAAPGKMADLHARFRDHTCKLLEKHGMELVGFWVPTDPKGAEEVLIYIVAHPSEEAAKKAWDSFRADPDWIKARDNSEKNGKILTKIEAKFFKGTDYSKIK